jgi:hypothetical protein
MLVQRRLQLLLLFAVSPPRENSWQLLLRDLLPLHDLGWMHSIFRRQLVDGSVPSNRRQRHLRLEFPTVMPPGRWYLSSSITTPKF